MSRWLHNKNSATSSSLASHYELKMRRVPLFGVRAYCARRRN